MPNCVKMYQQLSIDCNRFRLFGFVRNVIDILAADIGCSEDFSYDIDAWAMFGIQKPQNMWILLY